MASRSSASLDALLGVPWIFGSAGGLNILGRLNEWTLSQIDAMNSASSNVFMVAGGNMGKAGKKGERKRGRRKEKEGGRKGR